MAYGSRCNLPPPWRHWRNTASDIWLEISPHPALLHAIQECLAPRGAKAPVIASTRREREHESLLESAMDLHRASVELDFAKMTPSRRHLPLPRYSWDKSRWWSEAGDWREGRTGPAGSGLLDLRLLRATPTWIVRLDARHMAYLQDHKVENLVVFPAAAFLEMVLEAGAQLFEGRPFVIEDFEIRKPLILPEAVSEVQLEISYDPVERTFVIQSKFERGATWSVHVLGSMRGERTESAFAESHPASTDAMEETDVTDFYRHMSDLGLRYGEEFRPIRELQVGLGKSAGLVSLSEKISPRARLYSLHPVLFDGALQVFSAGAATVEDRKSSMKLPVRFSRILFLRPPGASPLASPPRCRSATINSSRAASRSIMKPASRAFSWRDSAPSAWPGRAAPAARGGSKNVVYHTKWERTAHELEACPSSPVPLERLRETAQETLDQVIAARGQANLEAAMIDGDDLAAAQLAQGFPRHGLGGWKSRGLFRGIAAGRGCHAAHLRSPHRQSRQARPVQERGWRISPHRQVFRGRGLCRVRPPLLHQ